LINLIDAFIADKDSGLRKVNREHNTGKEFWGDPGHEKTRFYREMDKPEYFGVNGGRELYKGLAKRISKWWFRCLTEAKT